VVGNPPWERIKLQEQEFFAARSPEISKAPNKAAREKLIKALEKADPESADARLHEDFQFAKRAAEAASEFARNSGRYPLTGTGDVNTYALFAEHFARLARSKGRSGVIVPSGIATDSSTSTFFGDLVSRKRLFSILGFENESMIFPGVHHSTKYCILTIGNAQSGRSKFCFLIRRFDQIDDEERHFELDASQIASINPNTRTAPVFRSRADAELTAKIYGRVPVLIKERPITEGGNINPWDISFHTRLWHMAEDSEWFRSANMLEAGGWERDGVYWINARASSEKPDRMLPLLEAKMIHHFDHRWGTYGGGSANQEEIARDTVPAEKENPAFEVSPRYWFPEEESRIRSARIPSNLKRAFREASQSRCLKALAEWITGYFSAIEGHALREAGLIHILGRGHAWCSALGASPDRFLLAPKTLSTGKEMQRETPLTTDDIAFLTDGLDDPLSLVAALIDRKQPRWLIGWRDITSAVVERTVITSVFPAFPMSHTAPLLFTTLGAEHASGLIALLSSLPLDFIARQKVGGTHMTLGYLQQLPVFLPTSFETGDFSFITPRVLELTYTSHSMRLWAEDLGHAGPPFAWDEARRAQLRAELDAFFARKYGLTRDELRYVLDPADAKGPDYPSETFRVLKEREIREFGEYRTQRLVLDAFDQLAGTRIDESPIKLGQPVLQTTGLPDGAWARPAQPQPGDTGAALAAILIAMEGPKPIRDVRLAAALVLEPRLFVPLLPDDKASEWRRLVGPEADPLQGNVAAFATRINATWGAAVRNHRGNRRLIEDLQGGTWAPSAGLEAIDTTGWPDGRAGFALEALRSIDLGAAVNSLPDDIQRWIADAAAA